jgi:hypothetical protein
MIPAAKLNPYPAYKTSGTCLRADAHRQIEWLEMCRNIEMRAAWSCNNRYTARPDDGNGLAAILANHGMTFHNYKDD